MSAALPAVFGTGSNRYVTDPAAPAEQVVAEIRRTRRREAVRLAIQLLLVVVGVVAVFRHQLPVRVRVTAAAVGLMSSAWFCLVEHNSSARSGGSVNLRALYGLCADTAVTVRAMRAAGDLPAAHAALYKAAWYASSAAGCARQASWDRYRRHDEDGQELDVQASRLRGVAREALEEAYAACMGTPVTPRAVRIAYRAISDDKRV